MSSVEMNIYSKKKKTVVGGRRSLRSSEKGMFAAIDVSRRTGDINFLLVSHSWANIEQEAYFRMTDGLRLLRPRLGQSSVICAPSINQH